MALGFFSLGYGRGFNQLLFWFRTVIELYAGSFPRELCASITGLGPLYASRVKFLLEGFLTSAAGTPPHMGVKVFLLVLHYLEICLYIVEAISTFWSPKRD